MTKVKRGPVASLTRTQYGGGGGNVMTAGWAAIRARVSLSHDQTAAENGYIVTNVL